MREILSIILTLRVILVIGDRDEMGGVGSLTGNLGTLTTQPNFIFKKISFINIELSKER